jgi:hypothetical protein
MEPVPAAVSAVDDPEGADELTRGERLELLAEELREAIRRKVDSAD